MPFFVRLQYFFFAVSVALPTTCYALVLFASADPTLMSYVAASAMVLCWFAIVIAPFALPGDAPKPVRLSALIFFWGAITVWAPVMWDFTWFLLHRVVEGATSEDHLLWYWWMYAVADTRFLHADPLMVWLEGWSGILGFFHAYALVKFCKGELKTAFFVSSVASSVQFYGTSVFFGHEALLGFRNIEPSFFNFYVKWWGMNGFWLIVPWLSTLAYWRLLHEPGYDSRAVIRARIFGKREAGIL